ncbi:MAG: hypothetical protein AB7G28_24945 [Pirellulales bacterium]
MRPRDWFAVGVRLMGVWIFYERGFSYLLAFGADRLRLNQSPLAGDIDTSGNEQYYIWYALGCTALAAYLVFGAEHLTRWAFREPAAPPQDSPTA